LRSEREVRVSRMRAGREGSSEGRNGADRDSSIDAGS
jgi:hypothetical protein